MNTGVIDLALFVLKAGELNQDSILSDGAGSYGDVPEPPQGLVTFV